MMNSNRRYLYGKVKILAGVALLFFAQNLFNENE